MGPRDCAGDRVYAAASLTDAFEDVAARFEATHPGTDVLLAFGGSSILALQIRQGAPADVFASADPASMAKVVEARLVLDAPQGLVLAVALGLFFAVRLLAGRRRQALAS